MAVDKYKGFGHLHRSIFSRLRMKLCIGIILICVIVGVFADFIASDLPIVLRYNGRMWWFPNITHPQELRNIDNITLIHLMVKGEDWGIFPPVPYGPYQSKVAGEIESLSSPSARHLMGTDDRGRDVFARIIHGTRNSLFIGFTVVLIYVVIGLILGSVAGYFGGWIDAIVSRITETMMSFPTLFFILVVQGLLQENSLIQLILVISLTRWVDVARLVRAEVMKVKNENYILAAKALGAGNFKIIFKHILPNSSGPVFVAASLGLPGTVLIESSLSFLGFGTPPPLASWGEILSQAYEHPQCWWLMVLPGIALFTIVVSFNIIGETIRDSVDPHLMYS